MAPHDQFQHATWRKSSYSNGATQCVEVASLGTGVAIRDSKNPPAPSCGSPPARCATLPTG